MMVSVRVLIAAALVVGAAPAGAQLLADASDPLTELSRMSLEQLSKVEVTSVSKAAQSLSSAPASIYVITREEILRSGVLSVPEALRLAPNLQITQLTSSTYSNGSRGFAGRPDVQNFSNKILMLIDGRSVYSPLFSGIEYDMQDVLMDDIERIEVISGPGATLWGANAMNGVINIITRKAADSHGTLARLDAGAEEQAAALRYGGDLGTAGAFRVYAKWFDRGTTEFANGDSAEDDWRKLQAGFRMDTAAGKNSFTVQGDYQTLDESFLNASDVTSTGTNLLGRWEHAGDRVTTRIQTYFDRVDREHPPSGIAFDIDTYDFDFQQSADVGARHRLVWGLGRRYNDYHTVNNDLAFVPNRRTLALTNLFVQDSITLTEEIKLTAGIKFEDNSYSDWSALPDVRLSWAPNDKTLFWLAGSRAIRAPTPFDTDVQEFVGGQLLVLGDPDFRTEKVDAFELGYRGNPDSKLSVSASVFYDEYKDLRTIDLTPVVFLPLRWGNHLEGSAYGFEAWANIQVMPWWRISPGFRSLHKRLEFTDEAVNLVSELQAGNDPTWRWYLKSSMDLRRFGIELMWRRVAALPEPAIDAYSEMNARFSWRASDRLEVAVKGFNLLNETHREYPAPQGQLIRRSVMAELRYNY
ncbi:MAG TPA: TonB-dependent receptor [Steroidobacteraceae bacterium]|jgi:iron complex outermembrane receptor protein|nr:TonB-dependent receptor [Steroidobacteraceae bacterium]